MRVIIEPTINRASIRQALRGKYGVLSRNIQRAWTREVWRSDISARAKQRYANAIVAYQNVPRATLKDKVAILLETGWRSFDMKPGLLKGMQSRVIPLKALGTSAPNFRTVSQKSPHDSWIHPGYKGAKVIERVRKSLSRLIREAIAS